MEIATFVSIFNKKKRPLHKENIVFDLAPGSITGLFKESNRKIARRSGAR
jgi:hypothetical protein